MQISDSEPTFSIGIAARKLRIAVPTLHLYEREGLIAPIRTGTKRRLYSLNDLRIIEAVQHLIHAHGLNFAGIRRLMAFLPCWKIRGCGQNSYRTCKVPQITDSPCWSSGKSKWRNCCEDCQSCPVYAKAFQIGELNIHDLMGA